MLTPVLGENPWRCSDASVDRPTCLRFPESDGAPTYTVSTIGLAFEAENEGLCGVLGVNLAVMLSLPIGSDAVSTVHLPECTTHVPSTIEPLRKVTVPIADEGDTVALNTTGDEAVTLLAGFALNASEVAIGETVTTEAIETDGALLASPSYRATTACVPTPNAFVATVQVPPDREQPPTAV